MRDATSKFFLGQVVHHVRFHYRGVVVDIDPVYTGSVEWYEQVARSRPPKNRPWYRVLVHGGTHQTYVAERHLEPDITGEPIHHPLVETYFERFDGQRYTSPAWLN